MGDDKCGWGFPGQAKKAHYFIGAMSLCRKWGFFGGYMEDDNHNSKDNCAECKRLFKKNHRVEEIQCAPCSVDEPHDERIEAGGVLCGGCGRRKPSTTYVLLTAYDEAPAMRKQLEEECEALRDAHDEALGKIKQLEAEICNGR